MRKYFMWAIVLLVAALAAQSCFDDDDNQPNFYYATVPADSVSMPETAKLRSIVKMVVYSTISEPCQSFYTFDYKKTGNERTISTIITQLVDTTNCKKTKVISPELKFTPQEVGKYKFRFWAGKDKTTKKDIFIEKEIEITVDK